MFDEPTTPEETKDVTGTEFSLELDRDLDPDPEPVADPTRFSISRKAANTAILAKINRGLATEKMCAVLQILYPECGAQVDFSEVPFDGLEKVSVSKDFGPDLVEAIMKHGECRDRK